MLDVYILVVALWLFWHVFYWFYYKWDEYISNVLFPPFALAEKFIGGNMASATYELQIFPSPSNFVETVEFHALIGGIPTVLVTGLPSNTTKFQYDFPLGATVDWYAKVHGDNGTTADSNHRTFVVQNLEQVQAAQAAGETFIKFNP